MITTHAPLQLPFRPKPFRNELCSSWLIRLAAVNYVSLEELLLGFEARYPSIPPPISLDLNLDPEFISSIARFSRMPAATLRRLSLEKRVANPESSLLLYFGNDNSRQRSRHIRRRLGYAFCTCCLAQQSAVHVPWEWTFSYLKHCSVHGEPLRGPCGFCGTEDPLPFGFAPTTDWIPCQWCQANLLDELGQKQRHCPPSAMALEKAYRAALLEVSAQAAPSGRTNGDQFRRFVDDTARVLTDHPHQRRLATSRNVQPMHTRARDELSGTISQLVFNSSSDCDAYERRARYRKSLRLWRCILEPLTADARRSLARASRVWPTPLQSRLASALAHTPRKSWDRSLCFNPLGPAFEYKTSPRSWL